MTKAKKLTERQIKKEIRIQAIRIRRLERFMEQLQTFGCERCKTIFYLNYDDWKDILKQKLFVYCPRCRFRIYPPKRNPQ